VRLPTWASQTSELKRKDSLCLGWWFSQRYVFKVGGASLTAVGDWLSNWIWLETPTRAPEFKHPEEDACTEWRLS